MRDTTALLLLKHLARRDMLRVESTTFMVPRHPMVVHFDDVVEAFEVLIGRMSYGEKDYLVARNFGVEVWTSDRLFAKLFRIIFVLEKIFPRSSSEGSGGAAPRGPEALPTLFVGSDKTQVRQVPLVEHPPWPFKFLLELGGMIVVKTTDIKACMLELKQFINNHPQFDIKVFAKQGPDDSIAIFTWWFREVPKLEKRENLNVE